MITNVLPKTAIEVPSMETVKAVFSSNLRALLKRDAMLPNHLANRLGVAASVVKRWIDGVSIPEATAIDAIRQSCGWSLADLFGEGKISPPIPTQFTLDDAIRLINKQSDNIKVKLSRRS
jgi:hypothetical protein